MARAYQRYEHEKRDRRMIDFDDLLRLCRRDLREDREFAQAQHWRYQHLFVDEFQDVNPLQRSLLDAWVAGRDDLCVVGDPNQAIYGWNGADPTALADFAAEHPSAEVVRLRDNYRSSPQILAVANAVLAGGALEAGSLASPLDDLRANRPPGPVPSISAHADDVAEARAVARSVRDHHRPGGAWSAQAVLCRTNAQLATLEQALHKADIPFRVRGGGGLLDQPEVKIALRDLQRHPGELTAALADLAASARPATSQGTGDDPTDTDRDAGPDVAPGDEPDRSADSRAANLEALTRLGHDYLAVDSRPSAAGFVAWLRETTRADQPDAQGDAVELATFHAAKGLEWPVVHLAGLEQGLVPIGHARTPDELAEERRLFYVAVTRAEHEVRCTWAETRTFGSRSVGRTRSPYLDDVEAASDTLIAGEAPTDWVAHLAAQRSAVRAATPHAGARRRRGRAGAPAVGRDELDATGQAAFEALKSWRTRQARAADVPAYVIFQDRVLLELAARRPDDRAGLLGVAGIGEVKADRFGAEILAILAEHAAS
jgi:DNA helicase-2/ATP-dependent DNA helicase PcrA